MLWIPVAVGSYFLSALSATIDKILLTRRVPDALVYAFYAGILSAGVLILAPFGFMFLPARITVVAMLSGASFLAALYFLYSALQKGETSQVIPVIGGLSPVFILAFSFLFLGEPISESRFSAIMLFIIGGWFLTLGSKKWNKSSFPDMLPPAVLSASFAAVTFIFSKLIYGASPFIAGFIWTRLGSFAAAILLLVIPELRHKILNAHKAVVPVSMGFVVLNKLAGAAGFLLLNYAISLGPISIINAMQGVQQLFIFLIALFLTFFAPHILKETLDLKNITKKTAGILFISGGFLLLAL